VGVNKLYSVILKHTLYRFQLHSDHKQLELLKKQQKRLKKRIKSMTYRLKHEFCPFPRAKICAHEFHGCLAHKFPGRIPTTYRFKLCGKASVERRAPFSRHFFAKKFKRRSLFFPLLNLRQPGDPLGHGRV